MAAINSCLLFQKVTIDEVVDSSLECQFSFWGLTQKVNNQKCIFSTQSLFWRCWQLPARRECCAVLEPGAGAERFLLTAVPAGTASAPLAASPAVPRPCRGVAAAASGPRAISCWSHKTPLPRWIAPIFNKPDGEIKESWSTVRSDSTFKVTTASEITWMSLDCWV